MKFYFFSCRTAIRYHIANQLLARGWERVDRIEDAAFTDDHLILNDEISKHLEYKHLLAALVHSHCREVMPLTYCINDANAQAIFAQIIYAHYQQEGKYDPTRTHIKWILKPSTLNNADHIHLFNSIEAVKKYYAQPHRLGGDHVLQQYMSHPDTIEGKKYTFRLPVIITNDQGVYISRHGYVNISALPFQPQEGEYFKDKKMHITNYVIEGDLSMITQKPTWEIEGFQPLFNQMTEIVKKMMQALRKEHPTYLNGQRRFEIFGFDFIVDANKGVWLLEINQGPDAPMFEENKMKTLFWEPFWKQLVDTFVLPLVEKRPVPKDPEFFEKIGEPNKWWKRMLHFAPPWIRRIKRGT